jgi:hypothetical protein
MTTCLTPCQREKSVMNLLITYQKEGRSTPSWT